ncbi:HAMP domain-containing histidine kinase [Dehalobacter sp. DCM]|uniref:sensor histidine kinase n=1 Tax=Dehalobacter sp. DCM TaxID=2907827 RepID=UPI00308190BD|nr:HAMP domain-containing histidine kinase [Dehalobacter sp. DCM]
MNLKKRLIAANAATVAIPLLITVLVAGAYLFIYSALYGNLYSWEEYQHASRVEAVRLDSERMVQQKGAGAIDNDLFRQQLSDKMSEIGGKVLILREGSLVYSSADNAVFSKIDLAKAVEAGQGKQGSNTIDIADRSFKVHVIALNSHDADSTGNSGNSGNLANTANSDNITVLLLVPADASSQGLISFLTVIILTFCLSFVITNILISYGFSQAILKPLNHLQKAAADIRTGNLDSPIAEEGDHEIKALCRDMELMRIKLKESILTQLKYEDNRKMLISSISHDLKTPVTSIKGYVEGILDGVAHTPEKMEKYLKTIYVKAEQVDTMIDDLLLYAKLDVNQLPFNFERTDIQEFIQHCVLESDPELEKHGITIDVVNDLKQPRDVLLDQERMKRVVMNIVDNSRKYMDKDHALIRVHLRERSSRVILEFQDNGCGVKEEDLPHIFDRFYRSDQARTGIAGSGLGLAIAKQVVEGHKGSIWAVSHGDEGTSILISLAYLKDA